jgi:hypothetical protein
VLKVSLEVKQAQTTRSFQHTMLYEKILNTFELNNTNCIAPTDDIVCKNGITHLYIMFASFFLNFEAHSLFLLVHWLMTAKQYVFFTLYLLAMDRSLEWPNRQWST